MTPPETSDCNLDAMASFAPAHGWAALWWARGWERRWERALREVVHSKKDGGKSSITLNNVTIRNLRALDRCDADDYSAWQRTRKKLNNRLESVASAMG